MVESSVDVQQITSYEALRHLIDKLHEADVVSLDTEFIRTDTYFPKAALIQLCYHQTCYLIDPLAISDLSPLAELLENPRIIKVLHACSEDLLVLKLTTGVVPQPLFDTQMAASFLGFGLSIGYQKLVQKVVGVNLPKEETRSDWLQRPLGESQKHYAAMDVFHLEYLYEQLSGHLERVGRLEWLQEDCLRCVSNADQVDPPEEYYRRVKIAWKLRPDALLVLKYICHWREKSAQQRDLPRGHVIPERSLWALARYKPRDMRSLLRVEGMTRAIAKKDGEEILTLIRQAVLAPKNAWPPPLPRPLPPQVGAWMKQLKATVSDMAVQLDIAPEILVRKKHLEALIRSGYPEGVFSWPDDLNGWRNRVILQILLDKLQELSSEHASPP